MAKQKTKAKLILEDGSEFYGFILDMKQIPTEKLFLIPEWLVILKQ